MKTVPYLTKVESRKRVAYLRCLGYGMSQHFVPGVGMVVLKTQKRIRKPKQRCKPAGPKP